MAVTQSKNKQKEWLHAFFVFISKNISFMETNEKTKRIHTAIQGLHKQLNSGIFSLSFKMLLLMSTIVLCACSSDDDNGTATAQLNIDSPSVEVGSEGGSANRYITSNVQWYVSKSADWVHVSPMQGSGSKSITITVDPNPYSYPRNTNVYFLPSDDSDGECYLTVVQSSGSGSSGTSSLGTPQNVKATVNGKSVSITWSAVSGATKYYVYRNTGSGNYSLMSTVYTNSATDSNPAEKNYYKIQAANSTSSSEMSTSVYAYVSGGSSGGNEGGQQKPAAPTGVRVSNEGNAMLPSVVIRWNEVSGATKYNVYKASSATGTYSMIGSAQYNVFTDQTPPTNGKSAYYKVKSVNSAGFTSDYSDYAQYTSEKNDEAFAPGYKYGSCTASGSTITLRWTNLTGSGYGKATKVVLRVWNPYAGEWQDSELSATATSASFTYTNKIDNDGYVKCGIVVSNAKGSFTAGAKVYNTKTKKWLN